MIVAERAPGAGKADPQPIADAVRAAISSRHGVTARDVLLVPARFHPPYVQRKDRASGVQDRICRGNAARRLPAAGLPGQRVRTNVLFPG